MYFWRTLGRSITTMEEKAYLTTINPIVPIAHIPKDNEPALLPFVAKMTDDLFEFAEAPKEIKILDEYGELILAGDNNRPFF